METSWINDPLVLGIFAGLISCILFLIFHQITISNIWGSSPFMLLISGIAGYTLVRSYLVLFENYSVISWIGYNIYFIISLSFLAVLSVIIFTPKYTSDEVINAGGAPPEGLIVNALPLTIIWLVITALVIVYGVKKSFTGFPIVLLTTAVLFLTLGLNISILGFVEISPQHRYLVEKFMAMNVMLGIMFFGIYLIIHPIFVK